MDTVRAHPAATALALATGVWLTACSTPPPPPPPPPPPALSAVLYQSRMDVDDRQVQVKVRNGDDRNVVVERMTFLSTAFDAPMTYRRRDSVVRGDGAVDMPVVLSRPVCDGGPAQHTVQVDYRLEDGATGTLELPAVDEHGAVAGLHEAECFALDVEQVVTLSIRDEPRLVERDGAVAADLDVDVTATGAHQGDLHVLHVGGTTLLQHADPRTLAPLTDGMDVDLPAPDSGTESFTLTLVPARCDAHAVAEDKQGTRFRVRVDLDGVQGLVAVTSPDPVRAALYDFVRQACQGSTG